ncbi:DUF3073 domain-containing protein [Galactobacter valiniphilus]|uniref:DUF3073 domain-containing protein n=1 Tax=Galactobacter valiniphilus TaxID=2676122 RepID=A0A399JGJ7_9MICC|nr:DUF3073 domain-containing protein [Galactobacter valiniphilus]RII43807.1 DUF3073 domain-containing protein [Galactobacter valiniphilus]
MGRGRQKAKATRQAREMKYYSPGTDLHALERELGSRGGYPQPTEWVEPADEVDEDDEYAEYTSKYDVEDDEDEPRRG